MPSHDRSRLFSRISPYKLPSDQSHHHWWLIIARTRKISPCEHCIPIAMGENWNLEKWEDIEETVERLGKSEKEIKERFNQDNILESKITRDCCLSLYGPSKGLRAIHCVEKNSKSRIRGAESSYQVFGRGAVLSFQSYYLWEFEGFFSLAFFVVLLLCNPNKIL